jgi:hypothetical protein
MKNAISVCRILFFVAIIGMMTESAYSQKLKKVEQTPLPIPQNQKDFIQKIQAAMINKKSASYTVNPVAKKEAMEKADNDLKKEIDGLSEIVKNDGLNDWIALCYVNPTYIDLVIEILAQNPGAALEPKSLPGSKKNSAATNPLSEKFTIHIKLESPKDKINSPKDKIDSPNDKINPDVLDSIKNLTRSGFVKFTLAKYPIKLTSGNTTIVPPPSALKAIAQLK